MATAWTCPVVPPGKKFETRVRHRWHLWLRIDPSTGQAQVGLAWPVSESRDYDDEDALSQLCGCDFSGRMAHAHMTRIYASQDEARPAVERIRAALVAGESPQRIAQREGQRTRYALTYVADSEPSLRTLVFGAQARDCYDSDDEASKAMCQYLGPEGLPRVLSDTELRSIRVRPVECWASTGEPCGIYFD